MTLKEILDTLQIIEGELDDAVNQLPEYESNTDTRGSIDGARYELYNLKDEIERAILDSNKDELDHLASIGAVWTY
mgnify:FL=1